MLLGEHTAQASSHGLPPSHPERERLGVRRNEGGREGGGGGGGEPCPVMTSKDDSALFQS